MIGTWLKIILDKMVLEDRDFEYLLGRGGKEETIKDFGIKTWDQNKVTEGDIGDSNFNRVCGKLGSRINGSIVIPFFSPTGDIIGIESRKTEEKLVVDYRTSAGCWNPVTIGMNKYIDRMLSGNNSVWIVEGVFDLFAMEWVVSEKDSILAMVRANVSKNHAKFFSRVNANVNLVFDNDDAGRRGSEIGVLTLKKYKVKNRTIKYSWKDPGEIWDHGGEKLLKDVFLRHCGGSHV